MGQDFIRDLLDGLKRVGPLDTARIKDVLIVSGLPEITENLRYLSFNHQVIEEKERVLVFSAVAVINNRRAPKFRLEGYRQKLSQIVFNSRWTRNLLDLFLNKLRCDTAMMDLLAAASAPFTLLGILQVDEIDGAGLFKRRIRRVRPIVVIPGIDSDAMRTVATFEADTETRKRNIRLLSRSLKNSRQSHGY
ncbi:MAG: hypothetical protein QNJ22_15050 [Desulfosarcinaceae bacterium]|nr:hypothetical protein [Desulfosarcinaceae bacterium]